MIVRSFCWITVKNIAEVLHRNADVRNGDTEGGEGWPMTSKRYLTGWVVKETYLAWGRGSGWGFGVGGQNLPDSYRPSQYRRENQSGWWWRNSEGMALQHSLIHSQQTVTGINKISRHRQGLVSRVETKKVVSHQIVCNGDPPTNEVSSINSCTESN